MLDLRRQFAGIRDEVLAAITAVCDAQQLILGPEVDRFERDAATFLGVDHAIGCASGTDALWLGLAAAGVQPGDRVLTTPFSFFATASAILRAGAHPVFADIDPATCNLSPAAATAAVEIAARNGHSIRALLAVHLYGQCADMDALNDLARDHHLLVLEDAAQAFGARWHTSAAGALGDAAAFSFYPTKNLSAFGDAGLVTTPSPVIAERSRMLRAHGMRRRYFHDELGWNSRLDTLQAAVLEIKLRHIDRWNRERQALAARYDHLFSEHALTAPLADFSPTGGHIALPFTDPRATHVFHQYVIRAPRRDDLRQHLAANHIASEVYYPLPLHQQAALAHLGYRLGDFPDAEAAAAQVLALPIYPELRHDEQDRVVASIRSFLRP